MYTQYGACLGEAPHRISNMLLLTQTSCSQPLAPLAVVALLLSWQPHLSAFSLQHLHVPLLNRATH
jgi:hypothetical protein